ncbi:Protein of unknown function [Evansella caseinilytica]|uniref:DUF2521 family protein n=1 Tax=Evansella caseinilytica TaxID=1503961 RepID=A0A1H3SIQ6_9BACI|nr:DUF2521 family protein [Evansella caseinilytica]SDZ37465.1 Protein of unknown function [Evansella caseinilytica]
MDVIVDLGERRRKKQWKFERSMLRSLSIENMRKDVHNHFFTYHVGNSVSMLYLVDYCLDIGIDAYLLGSEFGRFGYYGEPAEKVQNRCRSELDSYIEQTANQFNAWFHLNEEEKQFFHEKSAEFISKWWTNGFKEGEKKYRLRLH